MTGETSKITFAQYRFMDLTFFAVLGIFSVLISEGLFILMPDAGFYLSLVLLIGLLLSIRWGVIGAIPYTIALLASLAFHDRYLFWYYYAPFYIVSGITFFIPTALIRKYHDKDFAKTMFFTFVVFILSFISQALGASIYVAIVEKAPFDKIFVNYVATQLLNLALTSIFLALLYKLGSTLFKDVKLYLLNAQGEEDGSTK